MKHTPHRSLDSTSQVDSSSFVDLVGSADLASSVHPANTPAISFDPVDQTTQVSPVSAVNRDDPMNSDQPSGWPTPVRKASRQASQSRAGRATRSLAALALTTLLLSACAQDETSSASNPEATQSSSATSSASSSSSQVESSPTPSPSQSISYSGGSKAPAGEYRPADDLGPAQNVPRPVKPEGMNIESEEGLEKFLGYWIDLVNYGVQTGDFTEARRLTSDEYQLDREFFIWVSDIYRRGGWIEGGRRTAVLGEGLLLSQGEGRYTWAGNMIEEDLTVYLNSHSRAYNNEYTKTLGIYYEAQFIDNKWILVNIPTIEG